MKIILECTHCKISFSRELKRIRYKLSLNKDSKNFCSKECAWKFQETSKIELHCKSCNSIVLRLPCETGRFKNIFCSKKCTATFYNKEREFLPENIAIRCKYCYNSFYIKTGSLKKVCNNCKILNSKAYNKNHRYEINCILCGTQVVCINKTTKYCLDCKLKALSDKAIKRAISGDLTKTLKSISCLYTYGNKIIRCDSKAEYACLNFIENNYNVVDINRSVLILKYELHGKVRQYNPDFEVLLANGNFLIAECKTTIENSNLQKKWGLYYQAIEPKKQALTDYCKSHGYEILSFNKDMNIKFYNSLSRESLSCNKVIKKDI